MGEKLIWIKRDKKHIIITASYRPAEAVGFFPTTPGRELNMIIQKVLDEEGLTLN